MYLGSLDRPNISPPRILVHFGFKNGVSAKFWTGQERVRPAILTDFGPLRVFCGSVRLAGQRSQIFVAESCCRLTGSIKTAKNTHNTRFLRLARLGSAGRGVVLARRNVGVSGPGSPFVSSEQPVG